MSFLEKHYPQVGHARILLQQRLRQLQHQHQQLSLNRIQRDQATQHQNHHHHLQSNIIHLYDLVRKTAENQSSMQTQMNMMRNKSVGSMNVHQIEHRQKVHHLQNVYRKAEEKANSLHKRIQTYYPRHHKRDYHSRLERQLFADIQNQIEVKKEKLEHDWKEQYDRRVQINNQYNIIQEQMELQELNKQRQELSRLMEQEQESRKCIQENIRLKQIYQSMTEKPPTAKFNHNIDDKEEIVSKYYETGNLSDYQTPKSMSYNLINDTLKSPTSQIGKIYGREGRKENKGEDVGAKVCERVDVSRQSQLMSKDNNMENQTKVVHDTYDSIDNKILLIDQNGDKGQNEGTGQDCHSLSAFGQGNKSMAYLQTKPNNSLLSASLTQSKFKSRINHKLLQQSESESDLEEEVELYQPKTQLHRSFSNSTVKSKTAKSPYKSQYHTYSKSMLRPSSIMKKRYQATNQQQIYSNALERINNRIQNSYTIFQNSTFKNTKHQHTNLYSRYNLENKLRKEVKDKLSKHRLPESKYGLA